MSTEMLSPIVAADVALFTVVEEALRVLLLQRANEPQAGAWGLPGALLDPQLDLSLEHTARRALQAKTRVKIAHLEQVGVFSGPRRDPRGYSVSVLFYALLPADQVPAVAGSKAEAVAWADVMALKRPMAFDHKRMVDLATGRLRQKVGRLVLPLHLMPETFTLPQLQHVCETVLGTKLDKSSFRRRVGADGSLEDLDEKVTLGPYRPASLYRATPGFRFESEDD